MSNTLQNTLLGIFLTASVSFAHAKEGPEFNARIKHMTIPVDCDLLGPKGTLTSSFLKQLDIFGHLNGNESKQDMHQHLSLHGISPKTIEAIRQNCMNPSH